MTERRATYRVDYPAALLRQMELVGISGFVQEYISTLPDAGDLILHCPN